MGFEELLRQAVREELQGFLKDLRRDLARHQEPEEGRIVGIDKAAKILSRSRATIYRLTSANELPHKKIGSRLVFDVDRLQAWMAETGRK